MMNVAIAPDLLERVEDVATERDAAPEELLNEAVRRYLWELDRQYISAQTRIYRTQHAELKTQYLNQHIAMRNGDIVDNDTDFQILFRRIRQRYGNLPVMITKVEESPTCPVTKRGFRAEAMM